MVWCSHSPFKLSTSHPRPSLWHLEAIQPVHSWAGTCVQHAAHQSLKNAMTHWRLRLLYKLEVVYMKSDWYASQACTRYTIAHVNGEWCFIKKFTGSQLHFIVQNQIMWVLRCIRNCHTRGELISFPCLRWRWLRLYPCISSLLLATRQSIWATLVTKSRLFRLFRLLSLQPNYPQAFPPDVTSYPILWLLHLPRLPRAADITQDTNPRCRKAPTPPTRLHSVLVAPVFMDFLNCETICYLMWMELLIFLGYFLLVCLLKKGDAPAGFVRRGCAFCFVVVLSCSCWSCYFNWVVAIKS